MSLAAALASREFAFLLSFPRGAALGGIKKFPPFACRAPHPQTVPLRDQNGVSLELFFNTDSRGSRTSDDCSRGGRKRELSPSKCGDFSDSSPEFGRKSAFSRRAALNSNFSSAESEAELITNPDSECAKQKN